MMFRSQLACTDIGTHDCLRAKDGQAAEEEAEAEEAAHGALPQLLHGQKYGRR